MHLAEANVLSESTCSYQPRLSTEGGGETRGGSAGRSQINVVRHAIPRYLVHSNLSYLALQHCISGPHTGSRAVLDHLSAVRILPFYRRSAIHHHLAFSHTSAMMWHRQAARNAAAGTYNTFPYGTCTWWADQRYHQLHGMFVPWSNNANAWQWAARAQEYGWSVSHTPQVGAIIDLQPGTQGAYGLGHVAIVEKVLGNGHVIASSMSWGSNPWAVTHFQFAPGPGVTFISA